MPCGGRTSLGAAAARQRHSSRREMLRFIISKKLIDLVTPRELFVSKFNFFFFPSNKNKYCDILSGRSQEFQKKQKQQQLVW